MLTVQTIKTNILTGKDFKTGNKKAMPSFTSNVNSFTNLVTNPLNSYMDKEAAMNKSLVNVRKPVTATNKVEDKKDVNVKPYKNNFKSMLQNGEAKILAIIPRTFNAKDENGDEKITGNEKSGTFLNAIERLDEIKAEGFNTFHILPIHPTGKKHAMGLAGSLYSPLDFLQIDPNLIEKNDKRTRFNQKRRVYSTNYDIIICLEKEDSGSLEDFILKFGYEIRKEGDLFKIISIYNGCCEEYRNLCKCFALEQIEIMKELCNM